MADQEPLIRLDANGVAPVLSYNVPEATRYSARHYVQLDLGDPATYFKPEVVQPQNPAQPPAPVSGGLLPNDISGLSLSDLHTRVRTVLDTTGLDGFGDLVINPRPNAILPLTSSVTGVSADTAELAGMRTLAATTPVQPVTSLSATSTLSLSDMIVAAARRGRTVALRPTLYGTLRPVIVPRPSQPMPHFVLIETYQLSSYLGNYGAGRVIKTFSLLPGEKTKISVSSYTKTSSTKSNASSIFDSFSSESASEFERSVESEQSQNTSAESSLEWYVDAEAYAGIGIVGGSVKGGASGSTSAMREEFSKNVSKAASRHAAEASSKRDIKIDTTSELKTETGQTSVTEREIENINVGRTLNFVFRQMNQEFYSFLHLTDVRIAFANGLVGPNRVFREVPLSQLDSLLDEFVIPAQHNAVMDQILEQLTSIFDYADQHRPFVEVRTFDVRDMNGNVTGQQRYLRVKKDTAQNYIDPATNAQFDVPGVITAVNKFVMRTDGIVVEALLGQATALDPYSAGLQTLSVEHKQQEVRLTKAQADREVMAQRIINAGEADKAALFPQVYPPSVIHANGDDHDNGVHQ